MTKRQIKSLYKKGTMFLSEAVELLMLHHQMDRGAAFKFLGL